MNILSWHVKWKISCFSFLGPINQTGWTEKQTPARFKWTWEPLCMNRGSRTERPNYINEKIDYKWLHLAYL